MGIPYMAPIENDKMTITGSTLKWIALVTMMIDHVGAVILEKILMSRGFLEAISSSNLAVAEQFMVENEVLYLTYSLLRTIGRVSFPIFCFLLVEGFLHTSNKRKYALRLGLFALISEIPFDLAFRGQWLEFSYQNIFFTLLIGFLSLIAFQYVEEKDTWNKFIKIVPLLCIILIGAKTADLLNTDYGFRGVLAIMVIYIFRKNKVLQIIAGCLSFFALFLQLPVLLGFIPIGFYKGKKGKNIKYFSYLFYPVHLLALYLIAYMMGIV